MSLQDWSWVGAVESDTLTATQMEALQQLIDNGDADTPLEAAQLLDYDEQKRADDL